MLTSRKIQKSSPCFIASEVLCMHQDSGSSDLSKNNVPLLLLKCHCECSLAVRVPFTAAFSRLDRLDRTSLSVFTSICSPVRACMNATQKSSIKNTPVLLRCCSTDQTYHEDCFTCSSSKQGRYPSHVIRAVSAWQHTQILQRLKCVEFTWSSLLHSATGNFSDQAIASPVNTMLAVTHNNCPQWYHFETRSLAAHCNRFCQQKRITFGRQASLQSIGSQFGILCTMVSEQNFSKLHQRFVVILATCTCGCCLSVTLDLAKGEYPSTVTSHPAHQSMT